MFSRNIFFVANNVTRLEVLANLLSKLLHDEFNDIALDDLSTSLLSSARPVHLEVPTTQLLQYNEHSFELCQATRILERASQQRSRGFRGRPPLNRRYHEQCLDCLINVRRGEINFQRSFPFCLQINWLRAPTQPQRN